MSEQMIICHEIGEYNSQKIFAHTLVTRETNFFDESPWTENYTVLDLKLFLFWKNVITDILLNHYWVICYEISEIAETMLRPFLYNAELKLVHFQIYWAIAESAESLLSHLLWHNWNCWDYCWAYFYIMLSYHLFILRFTEFQWKSERA